MSLGFVPTGTLGGAGGGPPKGGRGKTSLEGSPGVRGEEREEGEGIRREGGPVGEAREGPGDRRRFEVEEGDDRPRSSRVGEVPCIETFASLRSSSESLCERGSSKLPVDPGAASGLSSCSSPSRYRTHFFFRLQRHERVTKIICSSSVATHTKRRNTETQNQPCSYLSF